MRRDADLYTLLRALVRVAKWPSQSEAAVYLALVDRLETANVFGTTAHEIRIEGKLYE